MRATAVTLAAVLLLAVVSCHADGDSPRATAPKPAPAETGPLPRNEARVVHVFVALCDNEHQGIVPVPARIGNGEDPDNNLYWGAAFGVRTFFKKSKSWRLVATVARPSDAVIERCVFKHASAPVYLVADAYRGAEIQRATSEFLDSAAGRRRDSAAVDGGTLHLGGSVDLVAYVGHDGLMDFSLPAYPERGDERTRDAVVLACASKQFFSDALRRAGANPLLWTTNLMAPEAYVLASALDGWVAKESGERVRVRAAEAYNTYQRCGRRSAMGLFATGW